MYVTYLRLLNSLRYVTNFVVVSKCKMFTCGYMQCVCVHIGAQKYTTTLVSSWPCSIHLRQFIHLLLFTRYIVQQCNEYRSGSKTLSTHQSYFLRLFLLGFYMPLIIHCLNVCCCYSDCLHTVKYDIVCEGRGVHFSTCSFMFVSTAVVELLDSTTISMSINNTLAELVCCCFS